MCEFMDNLGWFGMSSSEQWGTALKILGMFGAIGLVLWTIYSWRLVKIIEITNSLLQNLADLEAYWRSIEAIQSNKNKKDKAKEANQNASIISKMADHIIQKKLGLWKLRKLDKAYIYQGVFSQKLTERLNADRDWALSLKVAQNNFKNTESEIEF